VSLRSPSSERAGRGKCAAIYHPGVVFMRIKTPAFFMKLELSFLGGIIDWNHFAHCILT
jgi:hypothetical protein